MNDSYLVLYCGGTIGMLQSEQGLVPNLETVRQALALYGDKIALDFYAFEPLIDSSAITLADMAALLQKIQNSWHDYAGFLIIHGTDTMAYTASVLAFALAGADKPVLLTGSQKPLGAKPSDASVNLQQALEALCLPRLCGVSVAFNGRLFAGEWVKKTDAIDFAAFSSPNRPVLAVYGANGWRCDALPMGQGTVNLDLILAQNASVATYLLTPGVNGEYLAQSLLRDRPQAAVLLSYGNGNGPSDSVFIEALRAYTDAGGVLVNVSQVNRGRVAPIYAQGSALSHAGAIAGGYMTWEAAWAKLWVGISYGHTGAALGQWFESDILGEWR